jgi:hypothetical protein
MPLRAALFASIVLALWTFGASAFAMPAGLCDDRGASAVAPPPSFEAPDVAIHRARLPLSCGDQRLPAYAQIAPAHRILAPGAGPADHALLPAVLPLASPGAEELPHRAPMTRSPPGISWRVERPPRA